MAQTKSSKRARGSTELTSSLQKRARGSTEMNQTEISSIHDIKNNYDNNLDTTDQEDDENKIAYDSDSEESAISDLETLSDAGDHSGHTTDTDKSINDEYMNNLIQHSIRQQIEQKKIENLTKLQKATRKLIIATHRFRYKPYGFSVTPDQFGCNAIITKVTTKEALNAGLKIGYALAKIDNQWVIDMPHEHILQFINNSKLPTTLAFADRGIEYDIKFEQKPLGFNIMKDENMRNGRVCRITSLYSQHLGVKIDSYLVTVNGTDCWGKNYTQIINLIKTAKMPIICTFREAPKLKMLIKNEHHSK